MINSTDKSKLINTEAQANLTGDLKHFLKPFFTFRLYVQFKKDKKKCHFYGNEHECTYSQLKHAQLPFITLSKIKGYTGLITLVEKTWYSKIITASIYMRNPGEEKFNHTCRRWYNGEWEEIQDPILNQDNDITTLYYFFKDNRLQILTDNPNTIDFKTEIANAISNTTSNTTPAADH